MNAYELASKCDEVYGLVEYSAIKQAGTMLRQQADRIAELDKQVGIFDAELMKARISNSLMKTDRDRLAKGHKELSNEEISLLKAEIEAHKKTNQLLAQKIVELEAGYKR